MPGTVASRYGSTIPAITAGTAPRQCFLDGVDVAGVRGDVTGPGHGEPASGLREPLSRGRQGRVHGPLKVLAGPSPRGPGALPAHLVEGAGGQGGAALGGS